MQVEPLEDDAGLPNSRRYVFSGIAPEHVGPRRSQVRPARGVSSKNAPQAHRSAEAYDSPSGLRESRAGRPNRLGARVIRAAVANQRLRRIGHRRRCIFRTAPAGRMAPWPDVLRQPQSPVSSADNLRPPTCSGRRDRSRRHFVGDVDVRIVGVERVARFQSCAARRLDRSWSVFCDYALRAPSDEPRTTDYGLRTDYGLTIRRYTCTHGLFHPVTSTCGRWVLGTVNRPTSCVHVPHF